MHSFVSCLMHCFTDELIAFLDKHGIKYEKWMLD